MDQKQLKTETMKITIENISPAMAMKYLEKNTGNRKLRPMHISVLANEMLAGRWMISPQGIAFADDGTLIDGQNRLHAIIKSGVTVEMAVARGLARETMDVIDVGSKRSVADTLHLTDNLINCNIAAAASRQIVSLCFGYQAFVITIGITRTVLAFFGPEIQEAIKFASPLKPAKKSWVVAALAFGMKVEPSIRTFAEIIGSGESESKGSPAIAARNWIINANTDALKAIYPAAKYECIFNAMLHFVNKQQLKKPSRGVAGINHFHSKNRKFIETIRQEVSRIR